MKRLLVISTLLIGVGAHTSFDQGLIADTLRAGGEFCQCTCGGTRHQFGPQKLGSCVLESNKRCRDLTVESEKAPGAFNLQQCVVIPAIIPPITSSSNDRQNELLGIGN